MIYIHANQFAFENASSEEDVQIVIAKKGAALPEFKTFEEFVRAAPLESENDQVHERRLTKSEPLGRQRQIDDYLRAFTNLDLSNRESWVVYGVTEISEDGRILGPDWDHWESFIETPDHYIWIAWSTTA